MRVGDIVRVAIVGRGCRHHRTRRRYVDAKVVYVNERFIVVDTGLYRTSFRIGEPFEVRERESQLV